MDLVSINYLCHKDKELTCGWIYQQALGDFIKSKFTGAVRLETSLELADEWKVTMLGAL